MLCSQDLWDFTWASSNKTVRSVAPCLMAAYSAVRFLWLCLNFVKE